MFFMGVEGETTHMPETAELAGDSVTPAMWMDQSDTEIYVDIIRQTENCTRKIHTTI